MAWAFLSGVLRPWTQRRFDPIERFVGAGIAWSEQWRALLRAWTPTFRFYDKPDIWIEVRVGPVQPWRALGNARRFCWWNMAIAPELVNQMWCEGRVRAFLELAQEHGRLSATHYAELSQLIAGIMPEHRSALLQEGWSLRTLDALDGGVCLELHRPGSRVQACST